MNNNLELLLILILMSFQMIIIYSCLVNNLLLWFGFLLGIQHILDIRCMRLDFILFSLLLIQLLWQRFRFVLISTLHLKSRINIACNWFFLWLLWTTLLIVIIDSNLKFQFFKRVILLSGSQWLLIILQYFLQVIICSLLLMSCSRGTWRSNF